MSELLRFLRCYRGYRRILSQRNAVLLQDYRELGTKMVDREGYLLALAKQRRVLHFGFIDSIFLKQKYEDGTLLHKKLIEVSDYVFGVDIDEQLLHSYRSLTNDFNNAVYDIACGIDMPILNDRYDLILFPEVLEHVPNPGIVLENLRRLCELNRARVCITVPNGFYTAGFIAAMNGQELVHPDHYYYFTPHTLNRLLGQAGFTSIDMRFYNYGSSLAPGLTKAGIVTLCEP